MKKKEINDKNHKHDHVSIINLPIVKQLLHYKIMREPIQATRKELIACQFSSWYTKFRNLNHDTSKLRNFDHAILDAHDSYKYNNITIRSIIISPLPQDFIQFLKNDGVVLPFGAQQVSSFLPHTENTCNDWSSSSSEEQNSDHSQSSSSIIQHRYSFPQLNQQIQDALDKLGPCIPKLNWSAPKDVTWMNVATLKCETVGDVYLLLKSSDFCMFDLEHALDDIQLDDDHNNDHNDTNVDESCEIEYELVLRKWSHLHKSMEFRCFVSNHELIAISQRNHSEHYPHLKKEHMTIRCLLMDFFHEYIDGNFADGSVPNYVFDVYVDKNERVWLIDFNLWSTRTDALLFTWDELLTLSSPESDLKSIGQNQMNDDLIIDATNYRPEIRVVMSEKEVHYDPLASYRAPIDTVDLASSIDGSKAFQDFMAMCSKPSDLHNHDS